MRTATVFLVLLVSFTVTSRESLADEPFKLTIPDQGWTIAFESPPLRQFQGETKGKSFIFQATEQKSFHLSLFVEEPKNKDNTHEACFNYYWQLAKRNPMIDPSSIKVDKSSKFVKVTYRIKVDDASALNANYYFAFQGRWIDLHVSWFPPAAGDEQKLTAFEKNLSYDTIKPNSQPTSLNPQPTP
jgi:hypothetical protein